MSLVELMLRREQLVALREKVLTGGTFYDKRLSPRAEDVLDLELSHLEAEIEKRLLGKPLTEILEKQERPLKYTRV